MPAGRPRDLDDRPTLIFPAEVFAAAGLRECVAAFGVAGDRVYRAVCPGLDFCSAVVALRSRLGEQMSEFDSAVYLTSASQLRGMRATEILLWGEPESSWRNEEDEWPRG